MNVSMETKMKSGKKKKKKKRRKGIFFIAMILLFNWLKHRVFVHTFLLLYNIKSYKIPFEQQSDYRQ